MHQGQDLFCEYQSDTKNEYFMGMCMMGSHNEYEREYLPLSHFGKIKNEENKDEAIDTPITNGDVSKYKNLFGIERKNLHNYYYTFCKRRNN